MKMRQLEPSGLCWLALFSLITFLTGCGASVQTGGDVAQGRQALFRGDYPTALGYFQTAAQNDPNYVFGTELREGVYSYLGRAQYLNGQYPQARQSLQRELTQRRADNIARLYLGATLARLNERQNGLRQIETGAKGSREFLNYITTTFSNSFGQYWDPGRAIRKMCDDILATIAKGNFDWPALIASSESLAMTFEQEPDRANLQQSREFEDDIGR